MQLLELFSITRESDETEHWDALDRTGFYGKAGAGCLFLAQDTRRFLIPHRSLQVEQPGTWGTWGGAIDPRENPADAVRREMQEEAGYTGPVHLVPLLVFRKGTFSYSNFLAVVDYEFTPRLNWESQGYRWCKWGAWPQPLHFGLISLLNDPPSVAKMQELAATGSAQD